MSRRAVLAGVLAGLLLAASGPGPAVRTFHYVNAIPWDGHIFAESLVAGQSTPAGTPVMTGKMRFRTVGGPITILVDDVLLEQGTVVSLRMSVPGGQD